MFNLYFLYFNKNIQKLLFNKSLGRTIMFIQDLNKMSSMGKSFTEPMFDMQRVIMPYLERITRENISLYTDSMANFIQHMQSCNKINRPEDFMRAQLNFISEQGEKNLQFAQNVLKINEDTLKEFSQFMNDKIETLYTETEQGPEASRPRAEDAHRAQEHKRERQR